jgi:hypothetical protein
MDVNAISTRLLVGRYLLVLRSATKKNLMEIAQNVPHPVGLPRYQISSELRCFKVSKNDSQIAMTLH